MNKLPSFPQFTPDDRLWRIDWLGEVTYPGHIRRTTQPSIRVVLSPLTSALDNLRPFAPNKTDFQHQRSAWMPIGSLPLIRVGDIWQHGQRVAQPEYDLRTFPNLRIEPTTTCFIKAGLPIEEKYLLPLVEHPWHHYHTQSYCVAVQLAENKRLLIPCTEIIRFYFGSSSNLLHRLFTAPLESQALWIYRNFDPRTGHLHLKLADKLSGTSASDIGRIANSTHAWRAAAGIHASCMKASTRREVPYPYTGFPFEGTTTLIASGMWVSYGEQEKTSFLVFNLRSCSHPFPYKSLTYELAERQIDPANLSKNEGSSLDKKIVQSRSPPAQSQLKDEDPGTNKSGQRIKFDNPVRFPDLRRKSIWREQTLGQETPDVFLKQTDGSLEKISFGEACGGMTAREVDVCSNETSRLAATNVALPYFVKEGMRQIEKLAHKKGKMVNVSIILCEGSKELVFNLPMIVDRDGVIEPQSQYTNPDGTHRQRRGCFVEISENAEEPKMVAIIEGASINLEPEMQIDLYTLLPNKPIVPATR